MKNVLLSLALILMIPLANAGVVSIETEDKAYDLNDIITIEVIGTNFALPLDGFGLNVEYDESILEFKSVTVDSAIWEFAKSDGQNTSGKIESIGGASFRGVSSDDDSIQFAIIEFIAKSAGVSDLLLSNANDRTFAWSDSSLTEIPLDFQSAQVEVQVVPVPAAIWFMLSGLAPMMIFGRSRS